MKYKYHTVVIGAGSAGLTVTAALVSMGLKVALVEQDKMGGDCLNYGCVPSKALLKAAHLSADIKKAQQYGIKSSWEEQDLEKVMHRVRDVIDEIAVHDSQERFEKLGADVYRTAGKILDKNTVLAGDEKLSTKYIVVATGSHPFVPPINGLSEVEYLTNENIFNLKKLPKKLIVLGAGPIGLELGQAFVNLGSEVVVLDMLSDLFVKDDSEVGLLMQNIMMQEGIEFQLGVKIIGVENANGQKQVIFNKDGQKMRISGDEILLSLGRRPTTANMGLEEIGILLNKNGYILTNNKLQSSIKNIYACGDVVGPYQFTHMASYQASIVIRNILLPVKASVNYRNVTWVTYTKPEVAQVGYTQKEAEKKKIFGQSLKLEFADIDRAIVDGHKQGFLKLILDKHERIIGASLVSDNAGEMISLASLAIKTKMKASVFVNQIFPYPTKSEVYKSASLNFVKDKFKRWSDIMKKLFSKDTLKFSIFVLFLCVVSFVSYKYDLHNRISVEQVRDFILSKGSLGVLIYMFSYALTSIVLFPAFILSTASGAVWGPFLGTVYTVIGASLSASIPFYIARFMGHGVVETFLSENNKLNVCDRFISKNGFASVFMMRLIPIFPWDMVNYGSGLCDVKFKDYFLATLIGTIPGSFTYNLIGATLSRPSPEQIAITVTFTIVMFSFVFWLKRKHSLATKEADA